MDIEGWFHQAFENHTEMPFRQNLDLGRCILIARSKLWMVSSWRGVGRLRIFRTLVMANRQHNVREIFGRNSSGVGLRYKWFPLRIVNIAWRISHWIGCHVHYMDSGKLCCRRMFLITATRPDPTGVGLCGTEADDGWEWSGTNPRPVVVCMVVHLVVTVAGAMAMTDAAMLWESPSWERLELEKCIYQSWVNPRNGKGTYCPSTVVG